MFKNTKLEHEEALKKYGHPTNLSYTPLNHEQNNARKKMQNVKSFGLSHHSTQIHQPTSQKYF